MKKKLGYCLGLLCLLALGVIVYITKVGVKADDVKTYTIELDKYNISNDNTNANATTVGINKALADAKTNGYNKVVLPKGHYAIDTSVTNSIKLSDGKDSWTHHRKGIAMQSGMELDMTGAILEMVPVEDPYYSILTISDCENSVVTGGTILGDRDEHDYGMRINNEGGAFTSGDIDSTTGQYKQDEERVVTKDFIEYYEDWTTKKKEALPTTFYVIPLWNTTMNTVSGGCAYVYCYDKDGNYIGMTTGGNGFIKERTMPNGTAKIKISLKGEKRLDPVLAITKRKVYSTYEFGSCITVGASKNVTLNGVTAKDAIGDCVSTVAPPIKVTVDDLTLNKCVLENARRQGISFVATGQNYLVKDCYIGNINGTDPQSGIDIEHYDYVKDVVIDGTNFYNNKKLDIVNYNGTGVEVKNCNFTKSLATTYGHTMDIHDNFFGAAKTPEGKEITNGVWIGLGTKNNKFYNNTVKGGNFENAGEGAQTYDNTFIGTNVRVFTNGKNKYYNSTVWLQQREGFDVFSDSYFENCDVNGANDSPKIEVRNCEFNDSSFNGRGPCTVKNCNFNLNRRHLLDGWKTEATDLVFEECNITAKRNFLGNCNLKMTFKNCNIETARTTILQYGTITFDNSKIKFLNKGENTNITWNTSGYGYERCPWIFNNCTFESELPIVIAGGQVNNPTVVGNVLTTQLNPPAPTAKEEEAPAEEETAPEATPIPSSTIKSEATTVPGGTVPEATKAPDGASTPEATVIPYGATSSEETTESTSTTYSKEDLPWNSTCTSDDKSITNDSCQNSKECNEIGTKESINNNELSCNQDETKDDSNSNSLDLTPKTGDTSNIVIYMIIVVISICGIVAVYIKRRRL